MMTRMHYLRWFLFILLLLILCSTFYFHLYDYFNFNALKKYHTELLYCTQKHYFLTVLSYVLIYILTGAFSIPAGTFLILVGGLLFGPISILYAMISATIGSSCFFLLMRMLSHNWLLSQTQSWVMKMEKGFLENAFNYLLALRLMPIFPFWMVNVVAALLAVRLRIFIFATFIGILPITIIYTLIGSNLNLFLNANQMPSMDIIFTPTLFLSLVGLAILALLPVIYKHFKKIC